MTASLSMRLPAEWEKQAAVLIAWPHVDTDWGSRLNAVETTYVTLAKAITRFEPLVIIVADETVQSRTRWLLEQASIALTQIYFVALSYDNTWLRDSGPITLIDNHSDVKVNHFRFTGWGGKYHTRHDDTLVSGLIASSLLGPVTYQRIDWALEGGAIESDGNGTLLTTWSCLTQRHPGHSRRQIEIQLRKHLHAQRVLWLMHGHLKGDDTDAHIDMLARFAPGGHIVFQSCDAPRDWHYPELQRMENELESLRTDDGQPYVLHRLPWAQPIFDEERRLAASYANYLVINRAVLVPSYDDVADDKAACIIQAIYPEREVVQVPCRSLIWQNGSLHCSTMQLPAAVHLKPIV